jgi:cytidyltransferase-like protein
VTPAQLWDDPVALSRHLAGQEGVVLTSGGYDLIHPGHVRSILGCVALGRTVVVAVNSDRFLLAKKGFVAMPLAHRMEIVAAIKGVAHVTTWDDGAQYVDGLIRLLRPAVFAKGGDRSTLDQIAPVEVEACREVGCHLALGVGGAEKVESSSAIAARLGYIPLASAGSPA